MADVGEEVGFYRVQLLQVVGGGQAGLQLHVGLLQLGGAGRELLVGPLLHDFLFAQRGQHFGLRVALRLPQEVDAVGQAERQKHHFQHPGNGRAVDGPAVGGQNVQLRQVVGHDGQHHDAPAGHVVAGGPVARAQHGRAHHYQHQARHQRQHDAKQRRGGV